MLQIKKIDENLMTYIYNTHMQQDFPPEELKPLDNMISALHQGLYIPYGAFVGDDLIGYAFFIKCNMHEYLLLDYYAMCVSYRDKGYGSQVLQGLKETCKKNAGLILEVESLRPEIDNKTKAENETRRRRISFYMRNGLQKTRVQANIFTVPYDIYFLPCKMQLLDDRELKQKFGEIYYQFLGEKSYHKNVKIWIESEIGRNEII